tara:strand:- start:5148 stop:6077 length:930 start_codon:yes stop_codon:yes gene_type:complete
MDDTPINQDEINLYNLFIAFWNAKYFIILICLIFSMLGVLYAISLPNIYKSEATLIDPAAGQSGRSGLEGIAAQYSGVASMAGISIGSETTSQKDISLAMLKSRDFFTNYFNDKEMLKDLVSYKSFDSDANKSIYFKKGEEVIVPNFINSFNLFKKHFSFGEDVKSNVIRMSFEHQSPEIAKKWLQAIIIDINQYVKNKEVIKASATYNILMNQISTVNNPDLSFMISKLAEKQIQTITLSKVTDEFAFITIDSPYIPEKKSKPYRSWIVILISFIGAVFSSFTVLILYYLGFHISLKSKIAFIHIAKK